MGRLGLVIWLVSVIGSIVSHDPVRSHAEAWARRNVPWLAGADDAMVDAFVEDMLEEGDEAMLVFEHAPTDAAGLIAEVAGPVAAARDALDALDALVAELAQAQAQ